MKKLFYRNYCQKSINMGEDEDHTIEDSNENMLISTSSDCNSSTSITSLSESPSKRASLSSIYCNHRKQITNSNQRNSVQPFVDRISTSEKVTIDDMLLKFMCGCNIDFDVLNSCHFKNFINSLRPAYKIPSQKQ